MSNRANPTAIRTVYLDEWRQTGENAAPYRDGPACGCSGDHHTRDSAVIVERLGYGAKGAIREAARRQGLEAGHIVLLLRGVRSWNLVLEDGSPRPLDITEVSLLDEATVQWLVDELDEAWVDDLPLPNAPSAPSPDGSSASAIPTQTPPSPTDTPLSSTST